MKFMKARCCAQKRSSTTDILLALKVQHCRVDPWSSDSAFPCRHYATKKENEVKPGFLPSTYCYCYCYCCCCCCSCSCYCYCYCSCSCSCYCYIYCYIYCYYDDYCYYYDYYDYYYCHYYYYYYYCYYYYCTTTTTTPNSYFSPPNAPNPTATTTATAAIETTTATAGTAPVISAHPQLLYAVSSNSCIAMFATSWEPGSELFDSLLVSHLPQVCVILRVYYRFHAPDTFNRQGLCFHPCRWHGIWR